MARPQVADGGTASNMEGGDEYIEYGVAECRQGVVLRLGGWTKCWQLLIVKPGFVTKREHLPRTWINTLVRPKQRKRDIMMDLQEWDVGVWTGSRWLRIGTGGGQL